MCKCGIIFVRKLPAQYYAVNVIKIQKWNWNTAYAETKRAKRNIHIKRYEINHFVRFQQCVSGWGVGYWRKREKELWRNGAICICSPCLMSKYHLTSCLLQAQGAPGMGGLKPKCIFVYYVRHVGRMPSLDKKNCSWRHFNVSTQYFPRVKLFRRNLSMKNCLITLKQQTIL